VDHGRKSIRPALHGTTFIWLEPGAHRIDVSHSWCSFHPVFLNLSSDGTFEAVSNSTLATEFPISIRHMPNAPENLFGGISPFMALPFLAPLLMPLCQRYICTPEFQEKMQKWQEDAQKQVEAAKREEEEKRKKK
jgi:hypothetical protein